MSFVENTIKKLKDSSKPSQPAVAPVEVPPLAPAPAPPTKPPRLELRLDRAGLQGAGMLPPEHERVMFDQQFRQIKRPILAGAFRRDGVAEPNANVVMLASAVPGEGKSFMSVNLALSLAVERDMKVVLIDGDMIRPRLSQVLGLEAEPGLMDVLVDPALNLQDMLIQTDIPSLSLIPAGRSSEHATELLSSDRARKLFSDLASAVPNRLVVIDSPPVLLTTESQALAELSGQVILVVKAGSTSRSLVSDALDKLRVCRSVSLVLNQSLLSFESRYKYGYYYSDPSKSKR